MPTTNVSFSDSDDRDLEERIATFLVATHHCCFRQLKIRAKNGKVTLSGPVHSFYQRQLAVNCCRRVAGVTGLVDQIEVVGTYDSKAAEGFIKKRGPFSNFA